MKWGQKKHRDVLIQEQELQNDDIVWLRRMLSHNVRMPMAVISGYGELLRQGLLSDEEKVTCIQSICENITYMNQILSIIFGDDKSDLKNLERVDVVKLAHQMVGYVEEMARKNRISISIWEQEPELYIQAEPIPVMRIFYHLFENAFKYLKAGDEVQIRIYPVGDDEVLIVFRDNGPGMKKEEIRRIFERDFRGSNSAGMQGGGFGMYDLKRTMEAYGGQVEASSQEGKGLSVLVVFPKEEKEE